MNHSADKVGEIFREAGIAFSKLSEMTNLLHPIGESQPCGKWTDEEIEMLRSCVLNFALDLNVLSQHIKSRTVAKIHSTLKKKAFEDAGIPVRQVSIAGEGESQRFQASPPPTTGGNAKSGLGNARHARPAQSLLLASQAMGSGDSGMGSRGGLGKNAEVTLNMLNATENEVDVEDMDSDVNVKLELDANPGAP